MSNEKLSAAIGGISAVYINEAGEYKGAEIRQKRRGRWYAAAACLLLAGAIGAAVFALGRDRGFTVKLSGGEEITFSESKADPAGETLSDENVRLQELGEAGLERYFGLEPAADAELYAVLDAESGRQIRVEGSYKGIKLSLAEKGEAVGDTVVSGQDVAGEISGVGITGGYFLTDKNSKGERNIIIYAEFPLGENTVYLETSGPESAKEALAGDIAETARTVIENNG